MQAARSQSPKQIERASTAIALSMAIALGAMPKLNLTALAILAILSLTDQITRRVAIVGVAALASSAVFTPGLQSIGAIAFGFPATQYLLTIAEELPVFPWFRLNNPAVIGSVCVGAASYFSLLTIQLLMLSTSSRKELVAKSSESTSGTLETSLAPTNTARASMDRPALTSSFMAEHDESIDSKGGTYKPVLIDSLSKPNSYTSNHPLRNAVASASQEDYSDVEIRESIIEIVRFRSHEQLGSENAESIDSKAKSKTNREQLISVPLPNMSHAKPKSEPTPFSEAKPTENDWRIKDQSASTVEQSMEKTMNLMKSELDLLASTETEDSIAPVVHGTPQMQQQLEPHLVSKPRDEALRYLLWHLSESKDQPIIRERAS